MQLKTKDTGRPIYYKASSTKFEAPTYESRKVAGYFANFNTVDSDNDIIKPGAFAKSISERGPGTEGNRKIKYLHQHNICDIAGALLVLKEDEAGLYFEGEIERTPMGDVILERYLNGTYTEHSIGYKYVWSACDWATMQVPGMPQDHPGVEVFECKELNLFEGSVVTFGANSNTPFLGFKGTREDYLKNLNDELEYLLRTSPNYEYELRIRQLWSKQISLADTLAAEGTKEERKPTKTKADIDFSFLTSNFQL